MILVLLILIQLTCMGIFTDPRTRLTINIVLLVLGLVFFFFGGIILGHIGGGYWGANRP
jgi:hypothetical protein